MRTFFLPARRGLALLLLVALGMIGSAPRGHSGIFDRVNYRMDMTNNTNGLRTITRKTEDGVKRRLETAKKIEIADGAVTKFEPDTLIKLQQEGGPEARQAELREKDGKLELWIKDDKDFHPGGATDEAWLKTFLTELMKE